MKKESICRKTCIDCDAKISGKNSGSSRCHSCSAKFFWANRDASARKSVSDKVQEKRKMTGTSFPIGSISEYSGPGVVNTTYLRIKTETGWKPLHRYVVEQHIGRTLETTEQIHHIDGDGHNNDIANLQILSAREHSVITRSTKHFPRQDSQKCGLDTF